MRMQNFWIYVITVIVLLSGLNYICHSCLNESYSKIILVIAYLIIGFIIFSSIRWNNSREDKTLESRGQLMIKNLVDTLLAIIVIVLLYCRLVK